jgi:phage baseplate assembly protein W
MATQARYSDFDIMFSKNEFTGDVGVRRELNSVKQSIMNLIMTRKGERPFNPTYGIGLHDLLFQNFSLPILVATLNRDIEEHIDAFEPRAVFDSLEFGDNSEIDANSMSITINYFVLNEKRELTTTDSLTVGIKKVR